MLWHHLVLQELLEIQDLVKDKNLKVIQDRWLCPSPIGGTSFIGGPPAYGLEEDIQELEEDSLILEEISILSLLEFKTHQASL